MRAKLLDEHAGERTFALVFETGDRVMEPLVKFLRENVVTGARFTGIGAFQSVTLGYFDWQRKDYDQIPIDEQVEVLSLTGDVALQDGEPQVHAHVAVAKSDASAYGGHLIDAVVRPTLELVMVDAPAHLRKRIDRETGLALIALDL